MRTLIVEWGKTVFIQVSICFNWVHIHFSCMRAKGQLISKGNFGVFKSSKKMNQKI